MKDRDPEMYKVLKEDRDLEHRTRELAMQYRRASSDERTKIKQQLEETVNKHFDVRQQRRTLELKRLEGELQRLREVDRPPRKGPQRNRRKTSFRAVGNRKGARVLATARYYGGADGLVCPVHQRSAGRQECLPHRTSD